MKRNPGTDIISFHRIMPVQGIESICDWIRAWNNYERLLVNSDCRLYHKLVSYRELILACSRKFQWDYVYIYDQRFRALLGAQQSFSFGELDNDLYVTILDKSAVRRDIPRCHRCKSLDHKVAHCPFPRSSHRRRRHRHQQHGPHQTQDAQTPCPAQPPSTPARPLNSANTPCVTQPCSRQASSIQPSAVTKDTPIPTSDSVHTTYIAQPCSQQASINPPLDTDQSGYISNHVPTSVHHADGDQSYMYVYDIHDFHYPSDTLNVSTSSPPPSRLAPSSSSSSHDPPPSVHHSSHLLTTPVQRLNADAFRRGLAHHEDRDFTDYIVKACTEGVNIGYSGPRFYREFNNWPSASTFYDHVQTDIDKDVAAGIKVGPFNQPPFLNFVGSPMGAFLRKRSNKIRTIHDLSWKPGMAINDFISKDDFRIKYLTLDEVITSIVERGRHTLLAKLDLEAAFHHIPVRPQDFELLGSTFYRYNPVTNSYCKEYYFDRVLQFGARSSPKLFSDFATAAKIIMYHNGATYTEHYLDDYVTMGAAGTTECLDNLNTMMDTCSDLGFSLNPRKISQPSTVMEYLGIILDTDLLQARISSDRLEEVLTELHEWRDRHTASKRQILSLIGKLTFVSRVVRPGRTFVRRMISLATTVPHLHHKVSLTCEFQLDIDWWLRYLPQWNGVSLFPQSHWESNIDLHLFTDSSDLAAAGYFAGAWFIVPFAHEFLELRNMSINWRELFAIVVAAETFGTRWTGKRIMFHCDNMCVVDVLKSGTCHSERIMDLVRKLFFICARYEFELSTCYVNTKSNDIADALSRLQMDRFRQLAPYADQHMTMPVLMS